MDVEYKTKETPIERKEGIVYYECEHLVSGYMKKEGGVIWLGDHLRVIMCPICAKLEFGNQMMTAYALAGESKKRKDKFTKWLSSWISSWLKS